MKIRTIAASLLGILMITSAVTTASADNLKIAFVDLRRALNETTEGKAAMNKLKKIKTKLQKKIEGEEITAADLPLEFRQGQLASSSLPVQNRIGEPRDMAEVWKDRSRCRRRRRARRRAEQASAAAPARGERARKAPGPPTTGP